MRKLSLYSCCGAVAAILTLSGNGVAATAADSKFAMMAAEGGMTEVEMGKLAADKASDPDVKAYGQMMVDDHTKANDQLMSVAKDESMTLPTAMNPKHMAAYNKLKGMSGADFDKAYVKHMVMDHKEDVALFTKESNAGGDPKLKDFATQTLPVLKGHLDKITTIQGKMGK